MKGLRDREEREQKETRKMEKTETEDKTNSETNQGQGDRESWRDLKQKMKQSKG